MGSISRLKIVLGGLWAVTNRLIGNVQMKS